MGWRRERQEIRRQWWTWELWRRQMLDAARRRLPGYGTTSPDLRWWWDGYQWQPVPQQAPPTGWLSRRALVIVGLVLAGLFAAPMLIGLVVYR